MTKTKSQPAAKSAVESSSSGRKRASDFFDADGDIEKAVAPAVQEPKSKKAKTVDGTTTEKDASAVKKKGKSKSMPVVPPVEEPTAATEEDDVWADSEDDVIEDQSAALLQGFGSSDEEEDETDAVAEVPAIPSDKALAKKLKAASKDDEGGVGVVYVGRIPHGFYEHQMRAYFSQFGEITRLRLSRNKKTGHSKHYAFIEFASREVAKIVTATMNKYLLSGHILQVRTLSPEEVHPELFKGAGKRFKAVPRNKIEGRQLRLPKERDIWEKRIENETKRRKEKEEKLKMLGYEFKAPELAKTKTIPFRKQAAEETLLIADTPADEQLEALPAPKSKKTKDSKVKAKDADAEPPAKTKKTKVKSKAK